MNPLRTLTLLGILWAPQSWAAESRERECAPILAWQPVCAEGRTYRNWHALYCAGTAHEAASWVAGECANADAPRRLTSADADNSTADAAHANATTSSHDGDDAHDDGAHDDDAHDDTSHDDASHESHGVHGYYLLVFVFCTIMLGVTTEFMLKVGTNQSCCTCRVVVQSTRCTKWWHHPSDRGAEFASGSGYDPSPHRAAAQANTPPLATVTSHHRRALSRSESRHASRLQSIARRPPPAAPLGPRALVPGAAVHGRALPPRDRQRARAARCLRGRRGVGLAAERQGAIACVTGGAC